MKIKEREKIDKYLNHARELKKKKKKKKGWDMMVTMIPIATDTLGTFPKDWKGN